MAAPATATGGKVIFRRADNMRVGVNGAMGGWDVLRSRLRGIERGDTSLPTLYIMDNCRTLIRVIPLAQHDTDNPEDLSMPEDHCLDALRYGAMSRPWGAPLDDVAPTGADIRTMTFNQVRDAGFKAQRKRKDEFV
jgi:hypothetical protein